jgi:hypothetical protein
MAARKNITVKLYEDTHAKVKKAHSKAIGKAEKVMSFIAFMDRIIDRGLRRK